METTEQVEAMGELVRRSRGGDSDAFAEIVAAQQAAVFGTALRIVRERELAADVANRAFYKAHQGLASFDGTRPLRPWLLRIATNEALNALRGRAREVAHTLSGEAAEAAFEQLAGGPDPAELALDQAPRAALRAALARLPEAMRVATVLRYFGELSHAEIAAQTGQTANAVGVTLLRARERLRRELAAEGVTADALS
jgi:RNA polymerase sigma-70 factor, ECF subfamily